MREAGRSKRINDYAIRILDVLLASTALVALSPVFAAIALLLRFSGEGDVLYRQIRVGIHGRHFTILKFVTMLRDSPKIGTGEVTLRDDPRVLPLGRFLRLSKLNELPQLWNVVRGDLSIIGPRPLTSRYYRCYDDADRIAVSKIRPGLSGVGSIVFRDEESLLATVPDPVTFDEQVSTKYKGRIERWYVENRTVRLYTMLIIMTLISVVFPQAQIDRWLLKWLPTPPSALRRLLDR